VFPIASWTVQFIDPNIETGSEPDVLFSSTSAQKAPAGIVAAQLTLPEPGAGALGLAKVLDHVAEPNAALEVTVEPEVIGPMSKPADTERVPLDTNPLLNVNVYGATPPVTPKDTGVPHPDPPGSGEHGLLSPRSQKAFNSPEPYN
jgi:hypothetical protein